MPPADLLFVRGGQGMDTSYPIVQVLILVLAGIIAGGGLMILVVGWLASLGGDEASMGCASIGGALLVVAGFIAFRALSG